MSAGETEAKQNKKEFSHADKRRLSRGSDQQSNVKREQMISVRFGFEASDVEDFAAFLK